jgi:hypothetical protein
MSDLSEYCESLLNVRNLTAGQAKRVDAIKYSIYCDVFVPCKNGGATETAVAK